MPKPWFYLGPAVLEVQAWAGPGRFDPGAVEAEFARAGGPYYAWGNGPGDRYATHTHTYEKTLVCLAGSIVFHVPGAGDLRLRPGDRLLLPPHTPHAATVGAEGVRCVEAHRDEGLGVRG